MTAILLDTHVWVWSLLDDGRLSAPARNAIEEADTVLVSPVTFFEIAQKVRIGKWPEMAPHAQQLPTLLDRQGSSTASLTPAICVAAGLMDWDHRDPFDRLLAATAMHYKAPLISADTVFDGVVARVW